MTEEEFRHALDALAANYLGRVDNAVTRSNLEHDVGYLVRQFYSEDGRLSHAGASVNLSYDTTGRSYYADIGTGGGPGASGSSNAQAGTVNGGGGGSYTEVGGSGVFVLGRARSVGSITVVPGRGGGSHHTGARRLIPPSSVQAALSEAAFLLVRARQIKVLRPAAISVACRDEAVVLLKEMLEGEGINFGDGNYDWSGTGAADLVRAYIDTDNE